MYPQIHNINACVCVNEVKSYNVALQLKDRHTLEQCHDNYIMHRKTRRYSKKSQDTTIKLRDDDIEMDYIIVGRKAH